MMADKNLNPRDPAALANWVSGPGASKIKWGTPGDLDRCVLYLSKSFPQNTKGLCASLKAKALAADKKAPADKPGFVPFGKKKAG